MPGRTRRRRRARPTGPRLREIVDPLEETIHKELVAMLNVRHCLDFFHVANERKTTYGGHAHFKAMGVVSGVADLIMMPVKPGDTTHALELKRKGEKATEKQLEWGARAVKRGWTYDVVDNLADAIALIRSWGYTI